MTAGRPRNPLLGVGMVLGRLTVIEPGDINTRISEREVKLRCSCGNVITRPQQLLTVTKRPIRSCGCLRVDMGKAKFPKQHRRSKFTSWGWEQ